LSRHRGSWLARSALAATLHKKPFEEREVSKRYAFWRKPDGKAYRQQDAKHAPRGVLSRIGGLAFVNNAKEVSWDALSYDRFFIPIYSSIIILDPQNIELDADVTRDIVAQVLDAIISRDGPKAPIDPSAFLRLVDAYAAKHFRRPKSEYVFVASLSIKDFPSRPFRFLGSQITPLTSRRKYPYPESPSATSFGWPIEQHVNATEYTHIAVHVESITHAEAGSHALNTLDTLTGLWNLLLSHRQWHLLPGVRQSPILGVIHYGPIHTLHQPNGDPVGDFCWYNSSYKTDSKLYCPKNGWASTKRKFGHITKRLLSLEYHQPLLRLLGRYGAALNTNDSGVAFLQLWSVIEHITDTVGARYEETSKRASWIYDDHEIGQDMMEAMRRNRNVYVHSAKEDRQADQMALLLKSIVDDHLLRLVFNQFGVASIDEYAQIISLSSDLTVLQNRMRHTRLGLRAARRKHASVQNPETTRLPSIIYQRGK
jgi:hypothetical protein